MGPGHDSDHPELLHMPCSFKQIKNPYYLETAEWGQRAAGDSVLPIIASSA